MTNTDINLTKIDKFFNREYQRGMNEISIFLNEDGSYDLFDTYTIVKNNSKYDVFKKTSYLRKTFYSLKNAVSWCIFEKRNKVQKTTQLESLDRHIEGLDVAIQLHHHLIKKSKNNDSKLIYQAKLTDEEQKRKNYIRELDKLIKESMTYQLDTFAKKTKISNN